MLQTNIALPPGAFGTHQLGFTEDRFTDDSYLWFADDELWVSLIVSKEPGKGYFSNFIRLAEKAGYKIFVPTPMGVMPTILRHYGFEPGERETDIGPVELWSRPQVQGSETDG